MTATQLSANTVRTMLGKMLNISLLAVKPRPTLSEVATMTRLRWLLPQRATMLMPAKRILPNIIMVQPPNTACGMVVSTKPTAGKMPPRIMMTAPVAMVKRFTTPDMAASPTF